MMGAPSSSSAGRIAILVTSGGTHSASTWAQAVTDGLLALDPQMPMHRRLAAIGLRRSLTALFHEAFQAMTPTTTFSDVETATDACMSQIGHLFASSPWALNVAHPEIKDQIRAFVRRNLLSAADLALRTE